VSRSFGLSDGVVECALMFFLFLSRSNPRRQPFLGSYGVTGDVEWYNFGQVMTKSGASVITIDPTTTTRAGMGPGVCVV
jgi:hypothetical protein